MVRYFLTFALLMAHLTWVVRPLLPYAEYALRKSYIVEVLCINKERPELECDGKCYLKARIQEQQEPVQQEQGLIPLHPAWEALQVVDHPSSLDQQPIALCAKFVFPANQEAKPQCVQEPISPPPRFL